MKEDNFDLLDGSQLIQLLILLFYLRKWPKKKVQEDEYDKFLKLIVNKILKNIKS